MITFSTTDLPIARRGGGYEAYIVVTGGAGTLTFLLTEGELPPALTINAQGVIHGVPRREGVYGFTVSVSDGVSTISHDFELRVFAPLQVPRPIADIRVDPVSGVVHHNAGRLTFIPALMCFTGASIGGLFGTVGGIAGALGESAEVAGTGAIGGLGSVGTVTTWGGGELDNIQALGVTAHTTLNSLAFAFEDTYKGKPRLNITLHGNPPPDGESAKILLARTKGPKGEIQYFWYSGAEFADFLRHQGFDFSDYQSARLIVCHSAEGGSRSLASQFATATGLRTKGFVGTVASSGRFVARGRSYGLKHMTKYGWLESATQRLRKKVRITEDNRDLFQVRKVGQHYDSKWFDPQVRSDGNRHFFV